MTEAIPTSIQQVFEMRLAGASELEIAQKCGTTREKVRVILTMPEHAALLADRLDQLLKLVRQADDLDRKWNVVDLIDALRLRTGPRNALINSYLWEKKHEISLRELLDMTISTQRDRRSGFLIVPLLSLRCFGVTGFWNVVERLTVADFGPQFTSALAERIEMLRRCERIVGTGKYSWSKTRGPLPEWLKDNSAATSFNPTDT